MKATARLTTACLISLAAQAGAAPCAGPLSYSLPMVPGLNFIANQLNCGANTLPDIMPVVPDGTTVSVFNNLTKAFDVATYSDGLGWDMPLTLNPGQGAFLNTPAAFLLTLAGAANVP